MCAYHGEWFALHCVDNQIDDCRWANGVRRGNLRLHPMGYYGVSLCCITLQTLSDFRAIRRALLQTSTTPVPNCKLNA